MDHKPIRTELDHLMLNLQVLEAMDDWVRVIDADGRILFQNQSMKDALKSQDLEKCSFDCNILYGESECPKSVSFMTFLSKKTFNKEILFRNKEFSVKSSPILDEEGNVLAAVEVFRDISIETHVRRELFNANRRMTDDIKFARRIQTQLLPDKGRFGNLHIDYYYEPSEQLSGDLFDIIYVEDNKVGIYICDVVGHGVTASMMTMFIKQTMRAILEQHGASSPSKILYELRSRFGEMRLAENLYFTIFYGLYDTKTHEFQYSNAGHICQPILLRDQQHEVLESSGVPICDLFKELPYGEKSVFLKPGDRLVFYTDGITETKNFDRVEFGRDNFVNALLTNLDQPIENVIYEVGRYRWGEVKDDMAIMIATIIN